ncbi:hypothetical protein [Arthrobacter sp. HLT1-20]
MDYGTVELIVGSVLVLVPIAGVAVYGWWCLKKPQARMAWFFFLGPIASVLFGSMAGRLAMALFPPPYDAYFAGGSGLDLRGMVIIGGAMVGGAAGVVASTVLCAANLIRQYCQPGTFAR